MRRFPKACVKGVALAKKDSALARKTTAKYFKCDDRELLDESCEWIVKYNFSLPPYPAIPGIATILPSIAAQNPKAGTMKPADFADMRLIQELD